MANGLRPDITVVQVFDTPQPTVPSTVLPVCLIGLNRQFGWRKNAGSFVGGQPGQQYFFPGLIAGSVVEQPGVVLDVPEFSGVLEPHVWIQNEHGLGEVLGGDLSYNFVSSPPNFSISPSASVIFEISEGADGAYSAATGYLIDNEADFVEDQVATNDEIEVLHADGNYYKTFDVVDILSDNQLDVTRHNKATTPALPTASLTAEDVFGFRTLADTNQQYQTNGVGVGDLVTVNGWDDVTSVLGGDYGAEGSGTGGAVSRLFSDASKDFGAAGVLVGDIIFSEDSLGDWVPFFQVSGGIGTTQITDVENMITTPVKIPAAVAVGVGVPYDDIRYGTPRDLTGVAVVSSTTGEYDAQGVTAWTFTPSVSTNRIFHDATALYTSGTVVSGDEIVVDVIASGPPYLKPGNWPQFVVVSVLSNTELEIRQHDSNSPLSTATVLSPSFVSYEVRLPTSVTANTASSYTAEGGGGAPVGERRLTAGSKDFTAAGVLVGDWLQDLAGNTLFTVTLVHPAGVGTLDIQNIVPGNPPALSSNSRFAFYVKDQNPAILEVVSVESETSMTCKNSLAGQPSTGALPGLFISQMVFPDTAQDIDYRIKKTQTGSVLQGTVLVDYSARRNDFPNTITPVDQNTYKAVVGEPVPGNDLALGFKKMFEVLGAVAYFVQVPNDTQDDWTDALELAGNDAVYIPHILTQREDVVQLTYTHVTEFSAPEKKRERISYVSHKEVVQATRRSDTMNMTYSKGATGVTDVVSTAVDLTAYGVIVGDVISGTFNDGIQDFAITEARIISISPATPSTGKSTMRIVADASVPSPSAGTVADWIVASKPLTLLQRAQQQAAYAQANVNRRMRNIWPDTIEDIFTDETAGEGVASGFFGGGDQVATLGGHFLAVIEAGKRSNENPSQPLSNFPLGTVHKIIDPMGDNILYQDIILDGGNYYVEHEGDDQAPKAIRAISTDVSDLFKQEDNVPSQVDSFARKLRRQLKPMLGPIVIDEPFFDLISTNIQAVKDDVLAEKEMREIVFLSIEEDPKKADQFLAKFRVRPYISGAEGIITIYI